MSWCSMYRCKIKYNIIFSSLYFHINWFSHIASYVLNTLVFFNNSWYYSFFSWHYNI